MDVGERFHFGQNVAVEFGGGAFMENALSSIIRGNFTTNVASRGGGMYLTDSESVKIYFASKPGIGFLL